MKTVILTLVFTAIVAVNSFASSINPKSNIKDVLNKEITYPEFAKEQKLEGVVMVSFSINESGLINIDLTNASNEDLKKYVIEKLKKLIFKDSNDIEIKSKYNMKFEFKFQ